MAAGVYKDVCVWLRRRLRGEERKCPVSPPPAAPATTHHTAAAMPDPEQFTNI